jgi:hypothetical protein
VADARHLDLAPDSFDAAISRFGAMLIRDRLRGAAGEHVFAAIEQALDQFRGPSGIEAPGEALIGVGAR